MVAIGEEEEGVRQAMMMQQLELDEYARRA
jgi:hypothetical protein